MFCIPVTFKFYFHCLANLHSCSNLVGKSFSHSLFSCVCIEQVLFLFLNKNYILVEHRISQLMQFKWLYSRYDENKSSPERNYSNLFSNVMLTYYGLEFLVLQSDSKLIFNLKKRSSFNKEKKLQYTLALTPVYCPRLLITGIYPPSWKWNTDDNKANLSW